MKNQRGFTAIEVLIVIATVGIIAAILITTFLGLRFDFRTNAFEEQFGIHIKSFAKNQGDPSKWLDGEQKTLLRPMVAEKLKEICALTEPVTGAQKAREDFWKQPPTSDPAEIATRLKRLAGLDRQVAEELDLSLRAADDRNTKCHNALATAKQFDLLPQ